MSQFNPEIFMSMPNRDVLFDLMKGELITLGKYLQLEVKGAVSRCFSAIFDILLTQEMHLEHQEKDTK